MNDRTTTDACRLIRISAALIALASAALAFITTEPALGTLEAQADEARATLRSDAIVLVSDDALRAQKYRLKHRLAHLLEQDAEAVLLGDIDADAKRHGSSIVSVSTAAADGRSGFMVPRAPFAHVDLVIQFRGDYRALLETIADISRGHEIVAVRSAGIRREGDRLSANVPLTLFEPAIPVENRSTAERTP